MKNWFMNFALNRMGAQKAWDALDGKKTYITGTAALLSGAAAILGQMAALIATKDPMAAYAFLTSLPTNPGWLMCLAGAGALGFGHKADKLAADKATEPKAEEAK